MMLIIWFENINGDEINSNVKLQYYYTSECCQLDKSSLTSNMRDKHFQPPSTECLRETYSNINHNARVFQLPSYVSTNGVISEQRNMKITLVSYATPNIMEYAAYTFGINGAYAEQQGIIIHIMIFIHECYKIDVCNI